MSQISVIAAASLQAVGSRQLPAQANAGAGVLGGPPPTLQVGEQIKVTVVQTTATNAVIDVKGSRVLVGQLPGLQAGAEFTVRVTGLNPQLLFEMVPGSGPNATPPGAISPGTGQPSPQAATAANANATPAAARGQLAPPTLGQAAGSQEPAPATSPFLPPLTVEQTLTARVQQTLPDGRALIDLAGARVEAEAPAGLKAGTELSVRVAQLQPQVVLQILDEKPPIEAEALNLLRSHLGESGPVGQSLAAVQQALAEPGAAATPSMTKLQAMIAGFLPEKAPPSQEQIASFVRDGGLHFEAKLAQTGASDPGQMAQVAQKDLKGLVMQTLKEVATTPAASTSQSVAGPLASHLDHIETQQALNLLGQMQGGPYSLQLPFGAGQGQATAFLAVQPDRQGQRQEGGKPQGHDVLFMLDLERLGQTRIDAHVTDTTVRAIFYAERTDALNQLRSDLPAFREKLLSMGYQEVLLAAKPLQQMPAEKRPKFAALAAWLMPTTVSLVDARA